MDNGHAKLRLNTLRTRYIQVPNKKTKSCIPIYILHIFSLPNFFRCINFRKRAFLYGGNMA